MKEMLDKILALMLCFSILGIAYCKKSEAKYVIEERLEAICVEKADTDAPYINGSNTNVDYQNYKESATITYEDNLKVNYAKYWYNAEEKSFTGDGIDFESGATFDTSGWYKIEVSDMYENTTTYIFMIDKEFDSVTLSSSEVTDEGATLTIIAEDKLSGVKSLNLYINDELYKTYTYNDGINSITEELYVNIDDLPFYENAYVIAYDCYGNSKVSDSIIPNKNRIYDLTDFIKFRNLSSTNNFESETLYLLNDIDLSSVCSEALESWKQIGTEAFAGIFEGNNYTISNLYINSTSNFGGLFKQITSGGGIQNLNLTGNIVNSGNYTGSFVGNVMEGCFIKNCTSNVEISSGSNYTGGIAGIIQSGVELSYCINNGNVSGYEYTGGIVGYNRGSVEYCGNLGNITSTGYYTGGIAGFNSSSAESTYAISYSYNAGIVKGQACVAGICGAAWSGNKNGIIFYCVYNIGNVIATDVTFDFNGGILGGTYYNYTGSKVDNMNVIMYSYNIGTVSGTDYTNQITPTYANCTKCYYISGRTNSSGYGTAKSSSLFKISGTDSVLYLLNESVSGVWTINSNLNSGNVIFVWQNN